jgi:hypothetical protein
MPIYLKYGDIKGEVTAKGHESLQPTGPPFPPWRGST